MFEVLMPLQHHFIGKRLVWAAESAMREKFDDIHPDIYVIDLGLCMGEEAVHQKLSPFWSDTTCKPLPLSN